MIAVPAHRFLIVLPFLIPASSLAGANHRGESPVLLGVPGEAGISVEKTTPIIWGQAGGYMYLQLDAYQRGTPNAENKGLR
jgi:hypothetical protein